MSLWHCHNQNEAIVFSTITNSTEMLNVNYWTLISTVVLFCFLGIHVKCQHWRLLGNQPVRYMQSYISEIFWSIGTNILSVERFIVYEAWRIAAVLKKFWFYNRRISEPKKEKWTMLPPWGVPYEIFHSITNSDKLSTKRSILLLWIFSPPHRLFSHKKLL